MQKQKYKKKITKYTIRKAFLGNNGDGLIQKIFIYAFIIIVGFVFLFPLLHMISYSFMSAADLVNPLVKWMPSSFYPENFQKAFKILDYTKSLLVTIAVSMIPALIQTIVCSLIGYGLARFKFAGRNVIFAFVLATFIIPPQITMIPQFLMYKDLNILNSLNSYILPAIFGQGMKSAIFILIFFQFFSQVPKSLEEAAEVDGAGYLRIFFKIAIPTAMPGYLISFLLSTVWYWNETYMASMYFGSVIQTLPMKLAAFVATFNKMYPSAEGGTTVNEAIKMAGTCLSLLPLLILYFITQRWFIEGIDKSGITGE